MHGEHQDAAAHSAPDELAGDGDAVGSGERDVEDDHLRLRRLDHRVGLPGGARFAHHAQVRRARQQRAEPGAKQVVIVDEHGGYRQGGPHDQGLAHLGPPHTTGPSRVAARGAGIPSRPDRVCAGAALESLVSRGGRCLRRREKARSRGEGGARPAGASWAELGRRARAPAAPPTCVDTSGSSDHDQGDHPGADGFGAEHRVGAEFETSLLDQLPARFRVARLSAKGAELELLAWILPHGSWGSAELGQGLVLPAAHPETRPVERMSARTRRPSSGVRIPGRPDARDSAPSVTLQAHGEAM